MAPIAAIVACDNKNASDDSNSNRQKSYQGKVFALPTNLSLGMDLLVEDGKGHMNDTSWKYTDDTGEHDGDMAGQSNLMDAVFLPGRSGVATALGALPGTSLWDIMLQKLNLDPNKAKYVEVKKDVVNALATENPRQSIADVITKYNLPIDTKTFILGGNFGDASGIVRMFLNVSNNLYNTFVYGFGYRIGLNQPIPLSEVKVGKIIKSPNPFIGLKIADFEEPTLKDKQTVEWVIKEVTPATSGQKNGSLKIEFHLKDENQVTLKSETFEIKGFSEMTE